MERGDGESGEGEGAWGLMNERVNVLKSVMAAPFSQVRTTVMAISWLRLVA
jgi:hypothetical protein